MMSAVNRGTAKNIAKARLTHDLAAAFGIATPSHPCTKRSDASPSHNGLAALPYLQVPGPQPDLGAALLDPSAVPANGMARLPGGVYLGGPDITADQVPVSFTIIYGEPTADTAASLVCAQTWLLFSPCDRWHSN